MNAVQGDRALKPENDVVVDAAADDPLPIPSPMTGNFPSVIACAPAADDNVAIGDCHMVERVSDENRWRGTQHQRRILADFSAAHQDAEPEATHLRDPYRRIREIETEGSRA